MPETPTHESTRSARRFSSTTSVRPQSGSEAPGPAATKNRVVRVVDQKTAVVPLHADTLADPHKLLASVRSLVDLV